MRTLLLLAAGALAALAQTPSVTPGGILNAASFATDQPVAPGALISIFGSNLASGLAQADSIPLSTTLGGVSVSFNGTPAPLLFVSAGQINAQLPWNVGPGTASVVVTRSGAASSAVSFQVGAVAAGIFAVGSQAIAINPDGSVAAPAGAIPGITTRPARIADPLGLIILATGLGAVTPAATTGRNADGVLRNALAIPAVLIGGKAQQVVFAGLSPDFVGVNQINIAVLTGTTTGNAVPIQLVSGGFTSTDKITVAVSL